MFFRALVSNKIKWFIPAATVKRGWEYPSCCDGKGFMSLDFPCISNHKIEVSIVIDTGTYTSIIINELLFSYLEVKVEIWKILSQICKNISSHYRSKTLTKIFYIWHHRTRIHPLDKGNFGNFLALDIELHDIKLKPDIIKIHSIIIVSNPP